MTAADEALGPTEDQIEKGLKPGALGLVSSIVMGVASTAPAYSLAATLGFIVVAVGLQSPDRGGPGLRPDAAHLHRLQRAEQGRPGLRHHVHLGRRAFGPRTGWAGGWGIVAADILVMASLAQVAGQYVFLLFGAKGIGSDPTSAWVLLVGRAVDHRHDLHLLPGHRGLGQAAARPARHRGRHAAGAVRGGPRAGGNRSSPTRLGPSRRILAQPVPASAASRRSSAA